MKIEQLISTIKNCRLCIPHLQFGANPVFTINSKAKILIIGQAPGSKVHATNIPWNDRSGDRLRQWLDLDKQQFYNPELISITSMGLCYPGVNAKGGDLPPRSECAPKWHRQMHDLMPDIRLILLIGNYAQRYYLPIKKQSLTKTVYGWQDYLPKYVALPHPSWRNNSWIKNNQWFEQQVLVWLKKRVYNIINELD